MSTKKSFDDKKFFKKKPFTNIGRSQTRKKMHKEIKNFNFFTTNILLCIVSKH